jgi:hypothetical protein
MIRARDSLDRWALYAHHILDRVQRGGHSSADHIEWALAYLGDTTGSTKIPRDLQCGHRHPEAA